MQQERKILSVGLWVLQLFSSPYILKCLMYDMFLYHSLKCLGMSAFLPFLYAFRCLGSGNHSGKFCGSPTRVHLDRLATLFALDVTAPVKLTAAAVHHLHLFRVKPSAAAHQLAAVNGLGGLVAKAPCSSHYARRSGIVFAEVGARFQVHQIFICVWLELGVAWNQDLGCSHLAQLHFCRAVKLLLDDVADFTERWHGFPAGLHLAGARNAVALAFHPHVV